MSLLKKEHDLLLGQVKGSHHLPPHLEQMHTVRSTPLSPSVRQCFISQSPESVSWLFQLHHKVWPLSPFPGLSSFSAWASTALRGSLWEPRTDTGKSNHRAEKLCKPQRDKIPVSLCFSSFWIASRKNLIFFNAALSCCH